MEPEDRLSLIGGLMSAEAVHPRPERGELGMVFPKSTGLRSAAPGAGNAVPASRVLLIGAPGARIAVDDGTTGQCCQINDRAIGGRERNRGQSYARQMIRCSV